MNKVLFAISAVTLLTVTGYVLYSTTETTPQTDIVESTFDLYPEIPSDIKNVDVSFVPQQKVTIEEVEKKMNKVSLKMSAVMDDSDENKLQFFGTLKGIFNKTKSFFKKVVIPGFNTVKSTIDVVSKPIHNVCNPQGSISAFLSLAVQNATGAVKICKANNIYAKKSNQISEFVNNVGNYLRSSSYIEFSYISESQASDYMDRVIGYSVNMNGSLGARLECLQYRDELYQYTNHMLGMIDDTLDQESCNPSSDYGCSSVSGMDFYSNDRLDIQTQHQDQMVRLGEKISYNMSYVEACKKHKIFFQGDL